MKIGIVAGELSGDILGAGLIQALSETQSPLSVSGVGGPLMIQAHCKSLYEMERLAVMGLVEPLARLPELFRMRRDLVSYFLQEHPDVFVGVDAPDFNLGLELRLRQQHIPTVHYVSPSVWAWRKNRIHTIAKSTDLVLTLLPFEKEFYDQHGVPACFVGHPLADQIPLVPDKKKARAALNLDPDRTMIALLPGSRKNEIRFLAETFIQTALACRQKNPDLHFIAACANAQRYEEFVGHCKRLAPDLSIDCFIGQSHTVMEAADVILVGSGTATLEAMLYKRPMVIAYRMATLTYQIARFLVDIPHIGLPNLLAKKRVVPEFIQDEATPEHLARALLDYIDHPDKVSELEILFLALHKELKCNANQRAADAIVALLQH